LSGEPGTAGTQEHTPGVQYRQGEGRSHRPEERLEGKRRATVHVQRRAPGILSRQKQPGNDQHARQRGLRERTHLSEVGETLPVYRLDLLWHCRVLQPRSEGGRVWRRLPGGAPLGQQPQMVRARCQGKSRVLDDSPVDSYAATSTLFTVDPVSGKYLLIRPTDFDYK